MAATTYPTAHVDPAAKIGRDVEIGPFVTIEADVHIGDGCRIMAGAVIMSGTRLGEACKVFPGAVVGAEPQDLKFSGEYSTLVVGDRTVIRECCTINRGTAAAGTTRVGSDCLLMAYVHVAHDCVVGDRVVLANNVNLAGHVEVGDHAVLGGLAQVHQFVKIGTHAMIGGGSLLRKDVPPFVTAAREPVRFVGVNKTGLERRGFTPERIAAINQAYRSFFAAGSSRQDAISEIAASSGASAGAEAHADSARIVAFVEASTRGIIRGPDHDGED